MVQHMMIKEGAREYHDIEEANLRILELQREVETLKNANKKLHSQGKSLRSENEYLKEKLNKQTQDFKAQDEHVNSLKDLAVQVS